MSVKFYITKGEKTVGPCTLDDLRSFVAYGSIRESDLIRREGEATWTPLRYLSEFSSKDGDPPTSKDLTVPRRTARYREYDKVPYRHRGGRVLKDLIIGFLIFPPLLWRAAIAVFQGRIYTRKKNEDGYLITWRRGVDRLVTCLLIVNSVAWVAGVWWISVEAGPLVREVSSMLSTATTELQEWLGR